MGPPQQHKIILRFFSCCWTPFSFLSGPNPSKRGPGPPNLTLLRRQKGVQQQAKEASVKLRGPGPLFEGFGPLRRQKGVQQQAKEASVKLGCRGPLCEGFGPLRRQKGVQQQAKEASVKLRGRGPLCEGFGPLRRQKEVQQQAKEASVKLRGPGPLFERFRPLSGQKGAQEALDKSKYGAKDLNQNYFSKRWKTPWTPLRNTKQISK